MEVVLAVLILGVAEVAILTAAFRMYDRAEERRAAAEKPAPFKAERRPARFFADPPPGATAADGRLDALLLELERHVRLEQAAAESFLLDPTVASLHHRPSFPVRTTH
jgi:hypothetical protein